MVALCVFVCSHAHRSFHLLVCVCVFVWVCCYFLFGIHTCRQHTCTSSVWINTREQSEPNESRHSEKYNKEEKKIIPATRASATPNQEDTESNVTEEGVQAGKKYWIPFAECSKMWFDVFWGKAQQEFWAVSNNNEQRTATLLMCIHIHSRVSHTQTRESEMHTHMPGKHTPEWMRGRESCIHIQFSNSSRCEC